MAPLPPPAIRRRPAPPVSSPPPATVPDGQWTPAPLLLTLMPLRLSCAPSSLPPSAAANNGSPRRGRGNRSGEEGRSTRVQRAGMKNGQGGPRRRRRGQERRISRRRTHRHGRLQRGRQRRRGDEMREEIDLGGTTGGTSEVKGRLRPIGKKLRTLGPPEAGNPREHRGEEAKKDGRKQNLGPPRAKAANLHQTM